MFFKKKKISIKKEFINFTEIKRKFALILNKREEKIQ